MSNFVSDVLAHHGVKGMKWGVRKKRGGVEAAPKRKDTHHDRAEIDSLKRNKPKTLSNSEIQKINARLNLEKNLSSLKTEDAQRSIKLGKNWVDLAVAAAGTAGAVYGLSQTPLGKAVISGLKK